MPATTDELASLHKVTSSTGYRHVYYVGGSRRKKPYLANVRRDKQPLGYFSTPREAANAVIEYLKRRGNVIKKTKHSV